jgi:hypothetical protein
LGAVLTVVDDKRFTHCAEINVDAPHIWALFIDLCHALLGPVATLVLGELDDEPTPIGSADVSLVIGALEPHKYQLAHDGFLQFGLVSKQDDRLDEVFVGPAKHFKVWFNDDMRFRSCMDQYGLRQMAQLEFIDEYPRTTVALQTNAVVFSDLAKRLGNQISQPGATRLK